MFPLRRTGTNKSPMAPQSTVTRRPLFPLRSTHAEKSPTLPSQSTVTGTSPIIVLQEQNGLINVDPTHQGKNGSCYCIFIAKSSRVERCKGERTVIRKHVIVQPITHVYQPKSEKTRTNKLYRANFWNL